MHLKKPNRFILVPTISFISGLVVYLILSGTIIQGVNPLQDMLEASSQGSFRYVTNVPYYETTEVSFNMEDMYNSTHLQDFSPKGHFGARQGSLEFEAGMYGECLRWPSGCVIVDGLDIVSMSFTIEAWIYPASNDYMCLVGTESVYPFIARVTNGSMLYQFSGGSALLYSSQIVESNIWTHVALVYDVGSGVAKWYVNALEKGSTVIGARGWNDRSFIGRMRIDSTASEWRGRIDEFRIYKGEARTESEVEEDMETSIAYKLTVTGLQPDFDVAQLWYPDGEFARLNMLQQYADMGGKAEFNVYSFSGHQTSYIGVLKVLRSGRTYTSPILSLSYGDVYYFSLSSFLSEMQIAVLAAGLIITVPSILMVIHHYTSKRHKGS